MAVTMTADQLVAALRLGDSAEELTEVTRLLAYASSKPSPNTLPTLPMLPRMKLCAAWLGTCTTNRKRVQERGLRQRLKE